MTAEPGVGSPYEDRSTGKGVSPRGSLRSPQGELPRTGKAFDLPFAEINVVEDGRIKQHTVSYDQMTFLTALGAMQPAA